MARKEPPIEGGKKGGWPTLDHVDYMSTVELIARRDHEIAHPKPDDLGPDHSGLGGVNTPAGFLECRVFKSARASNGDIRIVWHRLFKLNDEMAEYAALQAMGIGEPPSDDPVQEWVRLRLNRLDAPTTKEPLRTSDLYADFVAWCQQVKVRQQTVPPINTFSQRLKNRCGIELKIRSWGTIAPFVELRSAEKDEARRDVDI